MTISQPQSGYTLPVFACASAVAALRWLKQPLTLSSVEVDLITPDQTVEITIAQVAGIKDGMALAITYSDPGDNLDITRNTPVWALVELTKHSTDILPRTIQEQIIIKGGEGIGHNIASGESAIYAYAHNLLRENLKQLITPEETIQVTIILPEGRQLADRTSNSAFGIVEGLSLLGTTGISQPLSAAGQLEAYREELHKKASQFDCLVFCVGENGLDLAQKLGINPNRIVKTANWLGALLAASGVEKVKSILLFGYHGKLIKLAGGIFHTHHHLADGRLEILTAHCANLGLPTSVIQDVFACPTTDAALKYLQKLDASSNNDWVNQVYGAIAQRIDQRSSDYIYNQSQERVTVGSILFNRDRQIIVKSKIAINLLQQVC